MKKILILCASIVSLSSSASIAKYCLKGSLVNLKNQELSSMKCEVDQRLTWEDNSVVFACLFSQDQAQIEDVLFVNSVTIGSDMNSRGWTKYSLNPKTKTGAFFLKGLGVNTLDYVKSQDLVVYYTDKVSSIKHSYVETKEGVLKLDLKAYLGVCR